jgi:hypothetical protein
MRRHRRWLWLGSCAVASAMIGNVPRAHASQYFDNQRGEIAARMSTQNTFQHNSADSINWVQWRNELRFDLKYDLIQQGTGTTWGPINALKFNILYRARMDPVYLLRDSYKSRDYDRGDFEFPEGRVPRELFLDLGFGGVLSDLSLRIGKQQVVWGESDLFRSPLDVVNPLDIRQNGFVGEDFADFRQPLWIAKALYSFGNVASFWNEAGLEAFFSPNGRPQTTQNTEIMGGTWKIHTNQSVVANPITRNVSVDFNQVRHPWEILRVGARPGDSPAVVQNADGSLSDFMPLIKNDVPPTELSTDALMAGVRLLGTTFGNTNFTLNYLYKRSDTASAAAAFSQIFDPTAPGTGTIQRDVLGRAVSAALSPDANGNGIPDDQEKQILNCLQSRLTNGHGELILDPRAVNPKFTGAWHGSVYSDPAHPELATGVARPGQNGLKSDNVPYTPVLPVPGDGLVHSSTCLDMPVFHSWTHIMGITSTYSDYDVTGLVFRLEESFSTKEPRQLPPSTPERLLAEKNHPGDLSRLAVPNARDFETRGKRYTEVWRSMVGFDYLRAVAPQFGHRLSNPLVRSLLTDQWFFTFQFLNEYDAHADHVSHWTSFSDRFQTWSPFFTLSGRGFFLHQTFHPRLTVALDTNQMVPLFFVQGGYFLTPKLEVKMGEILYAGSKRSQDSNFLYDYADRDTFYIRLTYFLA